MRKQSYPDSYHQQYGTYSQNCQCARITFILDPHVHLLLAFEGMGLAIIALGGLMVLLYALVILKEASQQKVKHIDHKWLLLDTVAGHRVEFWYCQPIFTVASCLILPIICPV